MYGFKIEVTGAFACFSRPELKVERVSYDVITPSAARGIFEAVYWKPAIRYVIDEIAVCASIKFDNIRRNEVSSVVSSTGAPIVASENRSQRAALVLRNVRYVITAHFEMTDKACLGDNEGKFTDIIRRRLEKGQHFYQPYLGTREFPARIRLIPNGEQAPSPISESRSLGLMLYDMEYMYETDKMGKEVVKGYLPTYFFANMVNGVINLRSVEVLR